MERHIPKYYWITRDDFGRLVINNARYLEGYGLQEIIIESGERFADIANGGFFLRRLGNPMVDSEAMHPVGPPKFLDLLQKKPMECMDSLVERIFPNVVDGETTANSFMVLCDYRSPILVEFYKIPEPQPRR